MSKELTKNLLLPGAMNVIKAGHWRLPKYRYYMILTFNVHSCQLAMILSNALDALLYYKHTFLMVLNRIVHNVLGKVITFCLNSFNGAGYHCWVGHSGNTEIPVSLFGFSL